MGRPIRLAIVDDTRAFRRRVRQLVEESGEAEVVGEFESGLAWLEACDSLEADVALIDIEMPGIDGFETMRRMLARGIETAVLIVSSSDRASSTLDAIRLGALDFIQKPSAGPDEFDRMRREIERGLAVVRARRRPREPKPRPVVCPALAPEEERLVLIGVSTGGPRALPEIVEAIGSDCQAAVLIAQHMPGGFTASLAEALARCCALEVSEAKTGDPVVPGRVLVAAGGMHMGVRPVRGGLAIETSNVASRTGYKPSVDFLFESVARHFRGQVLAVVMTGMGEDGLEGTRALRERGVHCIAQDEATSVVYGMPRAIVEAGLADEVLPLSEIGPRIDAFGALVPRS